jgi:hypothetical protein
MKIDYSIKHSVPKFNLDSWLIENEPEVSKVHFKTIERLYNHYGELLDEFRGFLNSSEKIVDSEGSTLTAIDIYNAIEYFKIRIEKLWLIFNLRLYKTYNVNKDTQVRYIVMRAFWIDDKGKPFRKFSKNLGAEGKVVVKGKIPTSDLNAVSDYILTLMCDLYHFEYIDNSEAGIDSEGNIRTLND